MAHPRIKDEPGIWNAFRGLAEQRFRVERIFEPIVCSEIERASGWKDYLILWHKIL